MAKKDVINKSTENEIKKDVVKEIKEKVINELNKEIKSTIVDSTSKFKEDLKEEMLNDIQVEVANTMRQEEKKILRGKSMSIFKRDIIILIFFGLSVYFGYCLYDVKYFYFMKSECEKNGTCVTYTGASDNTTTDDASKTPVVVKDKDWYVENYGYLLDNVKVNMNDDQVSSYYLYSNDYSIGEIKPAYLLNMAYSHLDKKSIKTNSLTITVEGESLRKAFEDLFGSLSYYQNVSFSYNCLDFVYNQEKDRFVASNIKCSDSKNEIVEEIDDMYEDGEVLYMITVAAIYNEQEKSFYSFDDLYDATVTNVTKEDLSKNAKKLNRYQYQFKKSEGVYYLDSITKLK